MSDAMRPAAVWDESAKQFAGSFPQQRLHCIQCLLANPQADPPDVVVISGGTSCCLSHLTY